ncbi:MAG: hypothetical protein PHS04_00540 [Tissierellia bacterium]|nr:hypothetical protein [Tissierellia bacterium]
MSSRSNFEKIRKRKKFRLKEIDEEFLKRKKKLNKKRYQNDKV